MAALYDNVNGAKGLAGMTYFWPAKVSHYIILAGQGINKARVVLCQND
jgi:hypothetical protein